MSIKLPTVDLSAATINATGVVDWQQRIQPQAFPSAQGKRPHIFALNESGVGLEIAFPKSGDSDFLAAGHWRAWELDPAETELHYVVDYILAGAGVSSLILVYFYSWEVVPDFGILGNSPVNVGGNVNVSQSSSLKNDNNVPNTSIIEATPNDQASSSWAFNNDASGFLQVLSANSLRKVINIVRGNAGATHASVTIGDSGDIGMTTFYGNVGAGSSVPASTVGAGYPAGSIAAGTLVNGVNLTKINSDAGNITSDGSGNVTFAAGAQINGLVGSSLLLGVGALGDIHIKQGATYFLYLGPTGHENTRVQADGYLYDDGNNKYIRAGSNGGGAAGGRNWVGTTDPGINANEGDTWDAI